MFKYSIPKYTFRVQYSFWWLKSGERRMLHEAFDAILLINKICLSEKITQP